MPRKVKSTPQTKSNRVRKKTGPKSPRIKIDWAIFDKLCEVQCTKEEIASVFQCSVELLTLRLKKEKGRTFMSYYNEKAKKGKASIRHKQFQVAMAGNTDMLKHLGKHILEQHDRLDINHTGTVLHLHTPDLQYLHDALKKLPLEELLALQALSERIGPPLLEQLEQQQDHETIEIEAEVIEEYKKLEANG